MKYFVFDVETWGLDATPESFALGVILGENYVFRTDNLAVFKRELMSSKYNNCVLFAHNALYDLSTIFGNILVDLDPQAVFNNSTFILAKHGKITYADSFNILPTKLEKVGEMMGVPKGITPAKFKTCKRSKITNADYDYCENDCFVIYEALTKLFNEIGCVRITLASLSMAYFRRKFLKEPIYYNDIVYHFFDSYFGGRVECFRLGKVHAQVFDINSMYPYSMKIATFPHPQKLRVNNSPKESDLRFSLEYNEGLAEITVLHKEHFYGFLPIKKDGKLIFPTGKFRGTWNFPEIRYALEQGIIEILEIHRIVDAPPMETPFREFVDTLFEKRRSADNEFEKYLYKIILNSLYGKFAQKKKFRTRYVKDLRDVFIPINAKVVQFAQDRSDAYIVEELDFYGYNTIPVFSSYITSISRVLLLKYMVKYIENEVVYVDTDCIAVNNYIKEVETGGYLGNFKLEKDKIISKIIGNKVYETVDGEITVKGVKKGSTRLSDGVFVNKQMIKPKTALRRNMKAGSFITTIKKISSKYDKRAVFSDGSTKPLKLK